MPKPSTPEPQEPGKDAGPEGPQGPRDDARKPRNLLVMAAVLSALALLVLVNQRMAIDPPLTTNERDQALEADAIDEIELVTNELRAEIAVSKESHFVGASGSHIREYTFAGTDDMHAFKESALALARERRERGEAERPVIRSRKASTVMRTLMIGMLPWVVLIALLYFFLFRQMRGAGQPGGLLSFGKSRATLAATDKMGVTFKDVAGIDDAKHEVTEVVQFLKSPDKFKRLGGRIPRGMLLVGPPGCGKTLLAKAIAGEAGVPFFSICGSDFVEMFVGVGASRVRDLFKQAKEKAPCIIFLDEIDAVGRKRGTGMGGGHDEREQTLNAILVEMDGFDTDEGVIVLASTNRPDVLDPALLRPGRFDREIVIDLPDLKGREEVLNVHARGAKLAADVDLRRIARGTPMFTGAELAALINEAAILAAMRGKEVVMMDELEEARDKVKWGRQKRSKAMDEEDRKVTAFHEAGHALLAALLDEVEPLHKVTIIPRGPALGATMQLPERDQYHYQRKRMLGTLALLYAGRIAEEMFCGDISAGASNDIERASALARRMVCEWGMSTELGPINFADAEESLYMGRDAARPHYSEKTAVLIDQEVRQIVDQAYQHAERVLEQNKDQVEAVAQALLRYETLSGADVERILEGGEPVEAARRAAEAAPAAGAEEEAERRRKLAADDLPDGVPAGIEPGLA